ncbi:MAG: hypothetical protein VX617_04740 [Pseudomonadota bacterium]|nr:hypothetical protein [Pseudomonadota bacterium]
MTILLRTSKHIPEPELYRYWISIERNPIKLPVETMFPEVEQLIERHFVKIKDQWLLIGRQLQTVGRDNLAHMPTAGSFGSDFGIMLAWTSIAQELAIHEDTILIICDDPWLFRQIAKESRTKSGPKPGMRVPIVKMVTRGIVARIKLFFRLAIASLYLRYQRREFGTTLPSILVYGHPESDVRGFDAYFKDLMIKTPTLQRVLHTDCSLSNASALALDSRTKSLHAWGNPMYAIILIFVRWKPYISAELEHWRFIIQRSVIIENSRAGIAINKWQAYCQKRWVRSCRPSVILWPWENHGWERNLVRISRNYHTKTIGYQHTVVGPHQFNYFLGANKDGLESVPDKIIASGQAYLTELIENGFPEERIEIGGALRYTKPRGDPFDLNGKIFLALSAIPSVSEALLKIAEKISASGYSILVKEHPMYPVLFEETDRIKRTGTPLVQQKKISSVIYSTGTSGVEALLMQLPALRLILKNEVAIDVLPKGYSNQVITQENVLDILKQISRPAKFDYETIFAEPNDQLWSTVFGIEI